MVASKASTRRSRVHGSRDPLMMDSSPFGGRLSPRLGTGGPGPMPMVGSGSPRHRPRPVASQGLWVPARVVHTSCGQARTTVEEPRESLCTIRRPTRLGVHRAELRSVLKIRGARGGTVVAVRLRVIVSTRSRCQELRVAAERPSSGSRGMALEGALFAIALTSVPRGTFQG